MLTISSSANPKYKQLLSLLKPRERKKTGLFLVEGIKEIEMAIAGGIKPVQIFFSEEIISTENVLKALNIKSFSDINNVEAILLTDNLFNNVSYRETTGGIILVCKSNEKKLNDLKLSPNPLIIILESVEKPGNLGAIIRTADAAKADAVILCDALTDLYNPNVIRASLGTVFTTQVFTASSSEAISFLKTNKIKIFATYLESAEWYHETDFTVPCAIVMGTESTGISKTWLDIADKNIKIPMLGKIDSMNVSVAAAVTTFEAKRQRNFK
ncbi:MAG: RNA methyltransferase [Bacteroidia bacterium]|nr:RNA methyltransferase [Bacteroidia bacterium]